MTPFSVELFFDADSSKRLSRLWSELKVIYGTPRRTELGIEPHLSIAVFRDGEPDVARERAKELAKEFDPFALQLSEAGHFETDEGVVYLEPDTTPPLIAIHGRFHELLEKAAIPCSKYYVPGNWAPHCTVGTDVPASHLAKVVDAARAAVGMVTVTSICGVAYRPVRLCWRFDLNVRAHTV